MCREFYHLRKDCLQSRIRLATVLRLKMDSVGEIVRRNPDIHVVFYLRDPRAIAKSVQQYPDIAMFGDKDTYRSELQYICVKMRRDLALYHTLSVQYPGAFVRLKHEHLVTDPASFSKIMYNFLGLSSGSGSGSGFHDLSCGTC